MKHPERLPADISAGDALFDRAREAFERIEVLLTLGDVHEAREACAELESLASSKGAEVLNAIAEEARGAVDLAEGNAEAALLSLRRAVPYWRGLEAPYPVAKIRVLMSLAYRELGDEEGSALELEAARATFESLGARPDVERVDALERREPPARSEPLTARELEVLRLIADGNTNKTIAARLWVSERTVDRHVSNIFSKLSVTSRAAATALAYERGLLRASGERPVPGGKYPRQYACKLGSSGDAPSRLPVPEWADKENGQ